jgi:hypothetical protein
MGDAPVPEAAIRGGAVGVSARWVLPRRARRTSSSGATVTRGLLGRTGWNESALMAGVIGVVPLAEPGAGGFCLWSTGRWVLVLF